MTHYQRRKTHEKETTKGTADPCRHTAYIFYSSAISFFYCICRSKSIFLAIGGQQSVTWNSFLDITALLLIITILFGRHFCGYACAFGSLGDALYELTAFIRAKCFGKKKKHGYPEEWVHRLQKVKYMLLTFLLLSCITGFYSKLQGMSPWDVFSMLTTGRLPKSTYIAGTVLLILIMVGMCTQERFFCQFLCPMGAVFAIMPIIREHFSNVIVQTARRSALSVRRDVRHIWILTRYCTFRGMHLLSRLHCSLPKKKYSHRHCY